MTKMFLYECVNISKRRMHKHANEKDVYWQIITKLQSIPWQFLITQGIQFKLHLLGVKFLFKYVFVNQIVNLHAVIFISIYIMYNKLI